MFGQCWKCLKADNDQAERELALAELEEPGEACASSPYVEAADDAAVTSLSIGGLHSCAIGDAGPSPSSCVAATYNCLAGVCDSVQTNGALKLGDVLLLSDITITNLYRSKGENWNHGEVLCSDWRRGTDYELAKTKQLRNFRIELVLC